MKPSAKWVVGVDGGATRTRFALADEEGRTLAESRGGPSLLGAGEDRAVADRLVEQVENLVAEAAGRLPLDALCVGLAGVAGRPEARELVTARIVDRAVAEKVFVVPDYEVAFLDAFGHGAGILIIAGTGSVAVGRAGVGSLVRIGGWGVLLGDEGSGYRLGLGGVRAAIRTAEGRNPPTTLAERLFGELGAESVQDVFEWSKRVRKTDVAALAPLVIEEADRGDQAASEIVARAVDGLVQHAEALARTTLMGEGRSVALVGGLVEPEGLLRERTVSALQKAGFGLLEDRVLPVRGAVRLALQGPER